MLQENGKETNPLIQCLQNEITLLKQLIEIVLNEKELLLQRNYAELETVAKQKESLSNQLEQQTKVRLRILTIEDISQSNERLKTFLSRCTAQEQLQIQTLNEQLSLLLVTCQQQNTVNGQVISANINLRNDILDAVLGKNSENPAKRYTASGNLDKSSASTRHEEV